MLHYISTVYLIRRKKTFVFGLISRVGEYVEMSSSNDYPPWVIQSERNFVGGSIGNQIVKRYEYKTEAGPYSWIDEPPAKAKFVDLYRLGVQFFVVAVVTAGLVITFRDEKATKQ